VAALAFSQELPSQELKRSKKAQEKRIAFIDFNFIKLSSQTQTSSPWHQIHQFCNLCCDRHR
jgi:hypothetical protein